ncbi:hypothetical protein DSECCO2_593340 [anaerobic digester metagenome]
MGQFLGIADDGRDPRRVVLHDAHEARLVLGLALAQNHEPHIELHELRDNVEDDVDTLLPAQPTDEAEHGAMFEPRRKAEHVEQIGLAGLLAVRIQGRVGALQDRIVLGAPDGIVRAVQDADEISAAAGQNALQAAPELRGHDLAGVAGADCGDLVRVGDSGLEQVEAVVELHPFHVPGFHGQAGLLEQTVGEPALKGLVVDGHDGAHPGPEGVAAAPEGHVGRGQGCVPILGVNDARAHVQVPDGAQGGAAEKDEALAVVEVVALFGAVVVAAVEIFAALDEVDGQAVVVGLIDVRSGVRPRVAHRAVLVDQMHGVLTRGQAAVERRDDGDTHAHAQESQGQNAHDVGQASGFGEGIDFRRQKDDVVWRRDHGLSASLLAKSSTILRWSKAMSGSSSKGKNRAFLASSPAWGV